MKKSQTAKLMEQGALISLFNGFLKDDNSHKFTESRGEARFQLSFAARGQAKGSGALAPSSVLDTAS